MGFSFQLGKHVVIQGEWSTWKKYGSPFPHTLAYALFLSAFFLNIYYQGMIDIYNDIYLKCT